MTAGCDQEVSPTDLQAPQAQVYYLCHCEEYELRGLGCGRCGVQLLTIDCVAEQTESVVVDRYCMYEEWISRRSGWDEGIIIVGKSLASYFFRTLAASVGILAPRLLE